MKKIGEIVKNNKFVVTVVSIGLAVMVLLTSFVMGSGKNKKKEIPLGKSESITFSNDKAQYHTAEEGAAVIIPLSLVNKGDKAESLTPETAWKEDTTGSSPNFTMPQAVKMDNGSIGVLTIPSISLSANVYESDNQMEDMEGGIAHFKHTSAWNGRIGLSAHNINMNGTNGYFLNLYKLKVGDTLSYETALGTRTYTVAETKTINQADWNDLERSDNNTIVLITCITGKAEQRLCVIAVEK